LASDILSAVTAAYTTNGGSPQSGFCNHGQFSDERYAFLFTPGSYGTDVPVGYYTSVYGLGTNPGDVTFTGEKGVFAEQGCDVFESGALDTFWRSAENFRTTAAYPWAVGAGMTWAVSQAAPLRNVVIDSDLWLFQYIPSSCCAAGFASGGWASGLTVKGGVHFGSQQQFMVRSSTAESFDNTVWNTVFGGVTNAPTAECGNATQSATTNQEVLEVSVEKPFISASEDGQTFSLQVPNVVADSKGPPYTATTPVASRSVDFSSVYVTDPEKDTAETINEALAAGFDVVISPGIYTLTESLAVNSDDQVILGLGFATLVAPSNGDPAVTVGDVDGVRIAGLLLEAGPYATSDMIKVGSSGSFKGDSVNPTVLTDVFVRVGGPTTGVGPVDSMMNIASGNVIIDNTWLWRADHTLNADPDGPDLLVKNGDNAVKNGLVVTGEHVIAYGLAAEHTNEDNIAWNGEDGTVLFMQAEIMYDFLGEEWPHSCYAVGEGIEKHTASGIGCYSFFRDEPNAFATSGINTNGGSSVEIDHAVSVFLNGYGGIKNVVDSDGQSVDEDEHVARDC
jgi:hypothetical protein